MVLKEVRGMHQVGKTKKLNTRFALGKWEDQANRNTMAFCFSASICLKSSCSRSFQDSSSSTWPLKGQEKGRAQTMQSAQTTQKAKGPHPHTSYSSSQTPLNQHLCFQARKWQGLYGLYTSRNRATSRNRGGQNQGRRATSYYVI